MKPSVVAAVAILVFAFAAMSLGAQEFLAGTDFSHLQFFEDRGVVYKTNGQPQDGLAILKSAALNCVRLRLFTSSPTQAQADPYNYTNNLDYVLPLAVRVKSAGLKFFLDFHYSDSWADPAKQTKPVLWTNLSFTQLEQQVRSYTSNTIAALKLAGAPPDYVQVGNEITGGLLWNSGRVSGSTNSSWSSLATLLKAGVNGIKDAAAPNVPRIIIHIDRGADWETTKWYFDNLANQQVPFDIMGQSYYPWWHGPLTNVQICLSNAVIRYGKPVIIAETAFPWANSTNLYGISATPEGQVQFVTELAKVVKGLPGNMGAGIFWWGAEYQRLNGYPLAGFDRRSFFGSDGNALPVVEAFGSFTAPVAITPALSASMLVLSWPLSGAGMKLKTCSSLASAVWVDVTNSVQSTGGIFTVSMPIDSAWARFYRLQAN